MDWQDNGDGSVTINNPGAPPLVVAATPDILAHLHAQQPSLSAPASSPDASGNGANVETADTPIPWDQYSPYLQVLAKHETGKWDPKNRKVGKAGDAGPVQMIPGTARYVLAKHPELADPDLSAIASMPPTRDPSQDPMAHYLATHPVTAMKLGEAHLSDLAAGTPPGDTAGLLQKWNPHETGYGQQRAAELAAMQGGDHEDVASELQGIAPDPLQPTTSAPPAAAPASHGQFSAWTPQELQAQGVAPNAINGVPAPAAEQAAAPAVPSDVQQQLPEAPDEYEAALTQQAKDASDVEAQKAAAIHEIGTKFDQLGPAPQPQKIDPGKYYENIGNAFGAHSPVAARLIGGIATGLFSGLGEIGGALSHRPNGAAQIIQEGMQHFLDAQNANNNLTRQQWADQHQFLTDQVKAKIDEITATGASKAALDNGEVLKQQLQWDHDMAIYKLGVLPPEQAQKLGMFHNLASDANDLDKTTAVEDQANAANGGFPSAATAVRRGIAGIPGVGKLVRTPADEAFEIKRNLVRNQLAAAMAEKDGKSPTEASAYYKAADEMVPSAWDGPETRALKAKIRNEWINERMTTLRQTTRGLAPQSTQMPASYQPKPGGL